MCGYVCAGLIEFMLKGNSFYTKYTNLFSPNKYKNNDIKIFPIDSKKFKMIKIYCIVCDEYRKLKNPFIFFKKR